jgi:transposase
MDPSPLKTASKEPKWLSYYHLTKERGPMSKVTLLGIDIAKNVFQLHGVDEKGNPVLKRRLTRTKLANFIATLPPCTIVMEACGSVNHWCRKFSAMGHETKQISAQFVKPFVKTNKNDRNDAEAICEAASRPAMRFVSSKSVWQEDIQAIHRIRSRLVQERTALVNQTRGLLAEYGIVVSQGINRIRKALPEILEDAENELSDMGRQLFSNLYEEILEKNKKIEAYNERIEQIFKTNKLCQKVSQVEGVGPMTATAIVAAVGEAKMFKNGRHFSAYLGLVPRQSSSGNKQKLLGISKRGDNYLRSLLVHGARAVVRHIGMKEDGRSKWVRSVKERCGMNKATVALANKNARIIWALLAKEREYEKAV